MTMSNQRNLNQISIFANLYQHAKNEVVSSICSRQMVLKSCYLIGWEGFGWYLRNKIYRICSGTQQTIQVIIMVQIQWKLMTKFFFQRRTLRSETIFDNWKLFKNDEKYFLFHLKSSFRCKHIQVLVTLFWSCRKNGSIRKIRLISKSMTWQPG